MLLSGLYLPQPMGGAQDRRLTQPLGSRSGVKGSPWGMLSLCSLGKSWRMLSTLECYSGEQKIWGMDGMKELEGLSQWERAAVPHFCFKHNER